MVTPNRIKLITRGRYEEGVLDTDSYPGMLALKKSNGNFIPHNASGGGGPVYAVVEDALQGGDITQKIAATNVAPLHLAAKGDKLLMLLQNGQNVASQTPLMSAGDGTLSAASGLLPTSQVLYQILAASSGITNTTVETTFSNGTYTIPANFLVAGDVLHIRGKAVASAQNSTNTHDVKVYVGSTTLADCGASALAAGNFAEFEITLTVRSLGASGKFVADVVTTVNPGGTTAETPATVAATTIDTTATQAVTVKSTASAGSTGNVIALQELQIDLERVGNVNALVVADEAKDNSGGTGTSGFNTAMFIRVIVL